MDPLAKTFGAPEISDTSQPEFNREPDSSTALAGRFLGTTYLAPTLTLRQTAAQNAVAVDAINTDEGHSTSMKQPRETSGRIPSAWQIFSYREYLENEHFDGYMP